MRTMYSIATLALPAILLAQVATTRAGTAPGSMRVRVESVDSARSAVFRLQTRGARVRVISGEVRLAGDTVRASTPAVLELESEPGEVALTSESGPALQVEIAPMSGAPVPRLVGLGRMLTVVRAERGGHVRLLTGGLSAGQR
jgi:hypothetical protein